LEHVAIVGGGEIGRRLASRVQGQPGFGMRVVSQIDGLDWRAEGQDELQGRAYRMERVRSLVRSGNIQRLILTDSQLTADERLDFVEECHANGVQCDFVPDLFELMLGRARVEEIDGVPLVGAKLHPLDRGARVQKRALDVLLSLAGLLATFPLLIVAMVAIKLESPGPALFRQRRLGRDGTEFDILKLRSMSMGAEDETGPVRAHRGDERATRLGAILRRTSIDELPQLWNVLKGEMSLVGPRPERPYFVGHFQSRIPRYLERHGVKSGITGWAQVHGLRGDTSIEDRTRYDIWYVENWSLLLDLKILALTLIRFLFQKEAY
jgi:exopolysaccharide biosynthesis polyprenyl glycosylphosphotransferase